MSIVKVLSLFDGVSCGMVALERAGITVDRYVAYEIDKYAITVSKANYPQIEHCGDVTTADFTEYKGFGLLIGGSPCTYWSIAKKDLKHSEHKQHYFKEGKILLNHDYITLLTAFLIITFSLSALAILCMFIAAVKAFVDKKVGKEKVEKRKQHFDGRA